MSFVNFSEVSETAQGSTHSESSLSTSKLRYLWNFAVNLVHEKCSTPLNTKFKHYVTN